MPLRHSGAVSDGERGEKLSRRTLAQRARHDLVSFATQLGPTAPTLCEPWRVQDLIAHLYVREHHLRALPGIAGGRFAHLAEESMASALDAYGFHELCRRLAAGPPTWLRPTDRYANTIEYVVHAEDIRRANQHANLPEIALSCADREQLAQLLGPALLALSPADGCLTYLQATDVPATPGQLGSYRTYLFGSHGDHLRAGFDPAIARRVRGEVRELVLYAFGRTAVANVVISEEDVR